MFTNGGERIVYALFGTLTVLFLAFILSPPKAGGVIYGVPNDTKIAVQGNSPLPGSRESNRFVPGADIRAEAIRENGLSQGGVPN